MAIELDGSALSPLSNLLELADFPLTEFLPTESIASVFNALSYTDAAVYHDGDNIVIDLLLVFEGELALKLPGSDVIAFVFGAAGPGLTSIRSEAVLGPDFRMTMREASLALRVSPDVLKDVASDGPAEIAITADVHFTTEGLRFENFSGAILPPAYVCGTQIVVEANEVLPVFGALASPDFLEEQEDFTGLAFRKLAVTIPAEYLETDPGAELLIEMTNAVIGTTGFTGLVEVNASDVEHPVTGRFLGFPFRFYQLRLEVEQNALVDVSLGIDVRLEKFEDGAAEKWVGLDVAFTAEGDITATLAAVQPPEAGSTSGALLVLEYENVMRLGVTELRLARIDGPWALYVSGTLKVLVNGTADWPEVAFDEVGIRSDGQILLPEGGGIVLAEPLVVSWHFARLTVTKFRFGHADDTHTTLQLALSAEAILLEGLPAGVSVEGLVVEWTPGSGAAPRVRFSGIGFAFGVPGSFMANVSVDYLEEPSGLRFRGRGALELTTLDMAIDVSVDIGQAAGGFTTMYLYADAKLLPTGIPIGATGLSIYGFQGLLAYNMRLDIDAGLPIDERYYELFVRTPIGVTEAEKWVPQPGQNALGAGIILGTADKGYALNVKGMIVVAFPDLAILLQARANFLKKKPDLATAQQGTLDALMVYTAADEALTIDIAARWEMPSLVSVEGKARAFFSFSDSSAWYLEIGRDEDDKRVVAKALKWDNEWLFTAGFWFRIDPVGVVTGVQIDVHLEKRRGGFWVEATGSARGEMALFWEPSQWEGSLTLSGRIAAGYRGLSVGLGLTGQARARVRRPFDVHVHVEACVEALLWEVCKSFDFDWKREDPPQLESPFRRAAATPRHWTIYREPGPPEVLDTGVVSLLPEAGVPTIHPHSVVSIDFGKPMIDATGLFNEAVQLDDGGFMTVGERSGWSAAYRIDAVTLIRDPDHAAESITPWGTWARETLEPNTTLRLQSSKRWADDGSLTGGGLDGAELDYCDVPQPTRTCVSLEHIKRGFGWLDDGSLYAWDDHALLIRLHMRVSTTELALECPDREQSRVVTILESQSDGYVVAISNRELGKCRPVELCYPRGHGRWDWSKLAYRGGLATGNEAWTVSPDLQLLSAEQLYELRFQHTAQLKDPDGTITDAALPPIVKRFRIGPPPSRIGALDGYVVSVVPSDGARPVFLAYDLAVEFVDDYVPLLYRDVDERLVLRLFDGQGEPVRDSDGNVLLVPVAVPSPRQLTFGELVWNEIRDANAARGCPVGPPQPANATTLIRVPLATLGVTLTPNSQYVAHLVSNARPAVALHSWGFATSSYTTFSDLVTRDRVVAPARTASALTVSTFDELAREAGVETIAYVDRFTITRIADVVATSAVLLEAPEPLGACHRLTVTIDGHAATLVANVDGTRVFARLSSGTWPNTDLAVRLVWQRAVAPSLSIAGNAAPEVVAFSLVGLS
ncbi:MAG: hypothetical protein H0T94_00795 [Acidimicrobiia bacterium]|nr:hypothetical protein [Acidimicrobiia bacterium]